MHEKLRQSFISINIQNLCIIISKELLGNDSQFIDIIKSFLIRCLIMIIYIYDL